MMNKLLTKTVKKWKLLSIILGAVLALSLALTLIFGVNHAASLSDNASLTVTVNRNAYNSKIEQIEEICESEFEENGLKVRMVKYGEMSGDDCEIVYVFDKDADLSKAKADLTATFAAKTAGEWNGSFISVSVSLEETLVTISTAQIVRTVIAVVVFSALAFAYVALRYRLNMGALTAICSFVSSALTAAIVLLVRIPVTSSLLYAVALSAPVTAALVMLTLNKLRATMGSELPKDEWIVSSVATKEILAIAATGGVALVLIGAIATPVVRWFALLSLIAFAASVFLALIYAPALYLPLQERADKKAAEISKTGYVGAKKQEPQTAEEEEVIS